LNDNKQDKITSICQLLELLQLTDLPGHWWSDNELASIVSYYNHDTYIFDEHLKTAIIHRDLLQMIPTKKSYTIVMAALLRYLMN